MSIKKMKRDILLVCIPVILTSIVTYIFNERQIKASVSSLKMSIDADRSNLLFQVNEYAKESQLDREERKRQFETSMENTEKLIERQNQANILLLEKQLKAARESMLISINESFEKQSKLQESEYQKNIKNVQFEIMNEIVEFHARLLAHENAKQSSIFVKLANAEFYDVQKRFITDFEKYESETFSSLFSQESRDFMMPFHEIDSIVLLGKITTYFSSNVVLKYQEMYNMYFASNARSIGFYNNDRQDLKQYFEEYFEKQQQIITNKKYDKAEKTEYALLLFSQLYNDVAVKMKNFVSVHADSQNVIDQIVILQKAMAIEIKNERQNL